MVRTHDYPQALSQAKSKGACLLAASIFKKKLFDLAFLSPTQQRYALQSADEVRRAKNSAGIHSARCVEQSKKVRWQFKQGGQRTRQKDRGERGVLIRTARFRGETAS